MLIATLVRCLSGSGKSTEVVGITVVVSLVGEAGESSSVEVDGEWLVGRAESIDTHVKLATTEEKRVQ